MNGFFDDIVSGATNVFDKIYDTASAAAAQAAETAADKASDAAAVAAGIASGKLVPLVSKVTGTVSSTVLKPVVSFGSKAINNIFSSPPKQTAQAVSAPAEQIIYENVPAATPSYRTSFSPINTLPIEHPMAKILPK